MASNGDLFPESALRWASVSACGRYRYELGRVWDPTKKLVLYCGLNPSTADGETDDPTARKWRGFATRWGFGGYVAGNLFGFRAELRYRRAEVLSVLERAARRNGVLIKCLGRTASGDPRHPLMLAYTTPLEAFGGLSA